MKKILYIQHATSLGGSVLILLSLMQRLDRTHYTPLVACVGAGRDIPEFYRERGFDAFPCPEIGVFPHTTGGWFPLYSPRACAQFLTTLVQFRRTVSATQRLIDRVRPDIVHLNSIVLGPSALGVARTGVPFVWHVREAVVDGHLGFRRSLIRRWLMKLPTEAIFISSDERRKLLGDRRGVVIPDFVDFGRFNRNLDGLDFRRELGLSSDDQVVLYLGGLSRAKGTHTLLEALPIVYARHPRLHVVIAGGLSPMSRRLEARIGRIILPLFGQPTDRQRVMRAIRRRGMGSYVHLLPFRLDVEDLLAASDVLVFPSVEPFSALPVMEAGAMAKPVVASRIGGGEEMVEDGETGILTPPGDVQVLAEAIKRVLADGAVARRMGENGFLRANRLYSAEKNAEQTFSIYDRILSSNELSCSDVPVGNKKMLTGD